MKGRFLLKNFLFYVLAISMLFIVSIGLFFVMNFDDMKNASSDNQPIEIYKELKQNHKITENIKGLMEHKNVWMIIIDEYGNITDSYRKPKEVPYHFEISDIARFTRWYLKEYPVFTYVYEKGLVVIGYPKNYYAKIASNYFKPNLIFHIIKNTTIILIIDLILLFILYFYSKRMILQEIKPIRNAIKHLSKGELIEKENCSHLSEILDELIMASGIIEEKNMSKNRWLRGVTHDIRTPLTIIMANAEELSEVVDDKMIKNKINKIQVKSELINKILISLNTIYLLEDKSDLKNESINLNKLIKNIVIDYINTYDIQINVSLPETEKIIFAREILIERLFRNIIDNSIKHNGKKVMITIIMDKNSLIISDNGKIKMKDIEYLNQVGNKEVSTEKGYGILIVKKIIDLYHFKIQFEYDKGLKTTIQLSDDTVLERIKKR